MKQKITIAFVTVIVTLMLIYYVRDLKDSSSKNAPPEKILVEDIRALHDYRTELLEEIAQLEKEKEQ